MRDRFKEEIAALTALSSAAAFPDFKAANPELFIFHADRLYDKYEIPKDPQMGHYALPLFEAAKALKMSPAEISRRLAAAEMDMARANTRYSHLEFSAVGGFNNIRVKAATMAEETLKKILIDKEKYGSSTEGQGKKIVIDYSSPNIAKPFGVGHLRSTAIGASLCRIYNKLGYHSIGINHLGDWGTQFGKMIVAFREWGDESLLQDEPVKRLYELYVRFHKEEERNPQLTDKARQSFKAMEDGDPEALALWQKFKDYSMADFNKIYDLMGVRFDFQTGESFYNDKMEESIARLEKAGLAEKSRGAMIVNLEKYGLPACLLKKADGATLYATRDITGILYRWKTFHFEKALYVVGAAQRDHFRQVFKVVELLEEAERIPREKRASSRLVHVEFGWIKLNDAVMSTRSGNIVFLEDVLKKAIALAREKIMEKNPNLKEIDKTARQIGLGAVIFADLATRKEKDVNFDWDRALSFEGETGPYLQYTHARLCSLMRNYGREIDYAVDFQLLDRAEESLIISLLYRFPFIIKEAAEAYEPNIISVYLLELASAFNKMYQRKDSSGKIDKIISDDLALTAARMSLVESVKRVIFEGLNLLGIEAPEEM
jgi:arginyl-tRNA synthetase